ncbi:RuBisCO operon transcriptional regulator CbbR [hydrothermal vent metagenome]|uniref:RuBisCO operon transcriptional regulator CbbR n=1 Tax=hydrothermal vent metagenome TaxID=652676 RepID=A0A3B0ZP21_9ZZZZ
MTEQSDSKFKGGLPDYLIRHTTFRQMQIFEAVARLGSFTRAAEELFLTQPTVSTQLKKLTDVMELPLLDQSCRQIKPTEAGEELYRAVRKIFDSLSDLDTKVAALKGLNQGRLRLGVITTAKYFAPEILGDFWREYPGVDISLKVTNRNRIIERIQNNEDDLYILGQPPAKEFSLTAYPFAPNPMVVLAAKDHPLFQESNISIARLAEEPLISREIGSGIRDTTMKRFSEHGLTPNIRMDLGSNEAIKHAVIGGLGVAILSLHTLVLDGADGPLGVLDVEGFPIERKWYLAHHQDKELSPMVKAFLDFARASEPVISERMRTLYAQFSARHKDSVQEPL